LVKIIKIFEPLKKRIEECDWRSGCTSSLQQGCEEEALSQDGEGPVVNFVVQLEVEVEGEWKQVVRYDCFHKFVHRDSYDLKGRQRKRAAVNVYKKKIAS
jgi:hypothetical protein